MNKMARMAMVAAARENQQRKHDPQPDPAHNVPHNPYADEEREMRYGRSNESTYNAPSNRRYEDGRYAPRNNYSRQNNYDRRNNYSRQENYGRQNRRENRQGSRMGGEGYVVWDNIYGGEDEEEPRMENEGRRMEEEEEWEQEEDPETQSESRMEYDDQTSNVTDMRAYSQMNHSPGGQEQHHRQISQQRQIGFQKHEKSLTREDAQEWVRSMRSADGSRGGRWKNVSDVKPMAERMGLSGETKVVEFYAIINAMYSDYCKVAKKHGVDKPEFYADLAKAWLQDEDAEDNKVMLYYDCIVKKE